MKLTTYSCDNKGCKFASEDKKTIITIISYKLSTKVSRKGKAKFDRVEQHYCSDECLRKDKGYTEIQ